MTSMVERLRLQAELGMFDTPPEHEHVSYGYAADRMEALEKALAVMVGLARTHASNVGPMHAWWDSIFDAELVLKDTK